MGRRTHGGALGGHGDRDLELQCKNWLGVGRVVEGLDGVMTSNPYLFLG